MLVLVLCAMLYVELQRFGYPDTKPLRTRLMSVCSKFRKGKNKRLLNFQVARR